MQDVSQTRLPSIDIHVKKLAKEPAERSWPKFKKVLIDYPRDTNLIYRQKLWEFQKMNRGAFRSHVTSLPEIPYRVNTNKPETASIGIQSDMRMLHGHGLKFILPHISKTITTFTEKLDVYLNSANDSGEFGCSQCEGMPNYDENGIEDPGFEFDSLKQRRNAGTMTEPFNSRKPIVNQTRRPVRRKKILKDKTETPTERPSSRKLVKTEDKYKDSTDLDNSKLGSKDDNETKINFDKMIEDRGEPDYESDFEIEPVKKLEMIEKLADKEPGHRSPSVVSSSSDTSSFSHDADNIGPSSHRGLDPVSVLDFLSGSRVGDARVMNKDKRNQRELERESTDALRKMKMKQKSEIEAERVWYKKLIGDKDLIDFGNYENFARVKPTNDSCSDSNEKYLDLGKNTPRRNINFTPRINSEFTPYKTLSRTGSNNPTVVPSVKKPADTPTKCRANSKKSMVTVGKSY